MTTELPSLKPTRFKSRREAKGWCQSLYAGSPIEEVATYVPQTVDQRNVAQIREIGVNASCGGGVGTDEDHAGSAVRNPGRWHAAFVSRHEADGDGGRAFSPMRAPDSKVVVKDLQTGELTVVAARD